MHHYTSSCILLFAFNIIFAADLQAVKDCSQSSNMLKHTCARMWNVKWRQFLYVVDGCFPLADTHWSSLSFALLPADISSSHTGCMYICGISGQRVMHGFNVQQGSSPPPNTHKASVSGSLYGLLCSVYSMCHSLLYRQCIRLESRPSAVVFVCDSVC